MKSPVGTVLVVAGAFLVALATLLPDYVVRSLTAAPSTIDTTFLLRAENATVLDSAQGRLLRGVTVEAVSALRGDPGSASGDVVVWNNAVLLRRGEHTLSYTERRSAFDRYSGESVNCCEAHVGDTALVRQSGLAFKWPAFSRQQAYPFFDTISRRALPMVFAGVENLGGLRVHRYTQRVPETRTEVVPGGLKGRPAHTYVWAERTYWVEPVTGNPVRIAESRRQENVSDDRRVRQLSLQADLVSVPEEVTSRVGQLRGQVRLVELLSDRRLSWGLAGAGVLAALAGIVLMWRRAR
ncbi:DUF3068 domain-containing protein [Nonomuraea sp. NPDC050663]|uniref:DUF3068 domain-containing protein n=1 Tax=Nonomuraea sp. NPDC050663 TaxID=3364370 RepID=UPI00379DAA2B